jgi:hypothetical protein
LPTRSTSRAAAFNSEVAECVSPFCTVVSSLMDVIVEVAPPVPVHGIASRRRRMDKARGDRKCLCRRVQVYRGNGLLRVKKSLGIRQLRMSAVQHSMNLSG